MINHFTNTGYPSRLAYCGIIYAKGLNASKSVLEQYQAQSNRGRLGFGFVTIDQGQAKRQRFTGELNTVFALGQTKATEILFHHRFPTSTHNTELCNHPIGNVKDYEHNYYLVHNGIIRNTSELHNAHTRAGLHYETQYTTTTKWDDVGFDYTDDVGFNDSECLLHELALVIEGKQDKVNAQGSIAFILLQTDKQHTPTKLFYGRNNGNPLKFSNTNNLMMLASEGQGDDIKINTLNTFDYVTVETTKTPMQLEENHERNYTIFNDVDKQNDYDEEFAVTDDEVMNFLAHANTMYEQKDWRGLADLAKQVPSLKKKHAQTDDQRQEWANAEEQIVLMLEQLSQPD